MNHTTTIQAVSERSLVAVTQCEEVIKSYEKYGESHLTKMSRRHVTDIANYISIDTGLEEEVCRDVMNALFEVLSVQVKGKRLFGKINK